MRDYQENELAWAASLLIVLCNGFLITIFFDDNEQEPPYTKSFRKQANKKKNFIFDWD